MTLQDSCIPGAKAIFVQGVREVNRYLYGENEEERDICRGRTVSWNSSGTGGW